jgi:hypothetical protein
MSDLVGAVVLVGVLTSSVQAQTTQAPGKSMPAAPTKTLPTPVAPGKSTPPVPQKAPPAAQAPSKTTPAGQAAGKMTPAPQARAAQSRVRR